MEYISNLTFAAPNARFIGQHSARQKLDTPALIVEAPVLQRNINRMAAFASTRGYNLRPHAKAHKSVQIARQQLSAGAVGISCATLGEAEVFSSSGLKNILITSPIVTSGKIQRLINLAEQAGPDGLIVAVDNDRVVDLLSVAAERLTFLLDIVVDFAAGYDRTGANNAESVLSLARIVEEKPNLKLRGLQAYAGHVQHIQDLNVREEAATAVRRQISKCIELLKEDGLSVEIISGVGTGTHDLDTRDAVYTEIQPGSYIFMDVEYADVLPTACGGAPFEPSLFLRTSVISANASGWVTTDAGSKSLAGTRPAQIFRGLGSGGMYTLFGDEHGKLVCSDVRLQVGDQIELIVPHCDPTVNLHNFFHLCDGDDLLAVWPIDARGL
ncbi:DSD1 family PLP-dependent enzyme [Methylorubrum thiocyanatum]|uniref:DSD1 family PLP-dependent enzyme n=1 Tax=Methylorubrum thiocyanatum TaxID=47958 RepID=UPI003F7F9ACC